MNQLVSLVSYMHNLGVVHRDLKPENLLFDTNSDDPANPPQIKVVDFGFARLKPELDSGMLTPCFTLQYAAPEILEVAVRKNSSQEGYNESCDLWSLGVILFAMLSGRSPFYSKTRTDSASHVMRRIKEGDFRLEGEAWRYVSSQAKNLTKGLLTVDPRKRLSMEQLRNNSWIGNTPNMNQSGALLTTTVLTTEPLERCLKQTYDAFHNVTREGFRLTPVASASSKLVQKRKMKQSLSSESSSASDRSSFGSKSSCSSMAMTPAKHWAESASTRSTASATKDNVEIFSYKSQGGSVAGFPSPTGASSHFPASLLTPLSINVSAAPSFAVNSSQTAHAPFLQSFSSSVPPPFSNSVSLSLIHSNLNVINSSSSVIQNVSHGFIQSKTDATSSSYPHPQHQQHDSQVDHGPLTRSRKRKLYEDKASEKIYDKSFGKTKVHRTGTIVIE